MKALWLTAAIVLTSNVAFANTRICVTVQQRSWYKTPPAAPAAPPPPVAGSVKVSPPAPMPMTGEPAAEKPAQGEAQAADADDTRPKPRAVRHEIDPTRYLERMLEYEI